MISMSNFLQFIRGGIKASTIFNYDGYEVVIRPISSAELDDAEEHGYELVDSKLAKLIMRVRLNDLKLTQELTEIPPEMFRNINKFYKEIDYWIVYHSMKDFQPDDFSIEDVRKMRHVHTMSKDILEISAGTKGMIFRAISNVEGKRLCNIIVNMKVPLADSAWDLTPLQEKTYEILSGKTKVYAKSLDDLDKYLYGKPLREVFKDIASKR